MIYTRTAVGRPNEKNTTSAHWRSHVEREIKLPVTDTSSLLKKIRGVASYSRTEYIRDVVYGRKEDKKKIRLRVLDNFESQQIDVTNKYKVSIEGGIRKEIEEIIYKGNLIDDAFTAISLQGNFKEENSYEKIRNNSWSDN